MNLRRLELNLRAQAAASGDGLTNLDALTMRREGQTSF